MPLAERRNKGANGMVSRVLVSEQRILLETPRVVVRFKEGMTVEQRKPVLARHEVIEIGASGLPPDTVIGAIVNGGDALAHSIALMKESDVLYSEPDFIEHLGQRHTPTDPEFANQWHHKTIQAEKAWDSSKGEEIFDRRDRQRFRHRASRPAIRSADRLVSSDARSRRCRFPAR